MKTIEVTNSDVCLVPLPGVDCKAVRGTAVARLEREGRWAGFYVVSAVTDRRMQRRDIDTSRCPFMAAGLVEYINDYQPED